MNGVPREENGFTLIEIMIVIAIIGILAAIAIPNFIAYRDKAFCTYAENDANSITATLADYFAIPSHNTLILPINITGNKVSGGVPTTVNGITYPVLSGSNTASVSGSLQAFTVVVLDTAQRCPAGYQTGNSNWHNWCYSKTIH